MSCVVYLEGDLRIEPCPLGDENFRETITSVVNDESKRRTHGECPWKIDHETWTFILDEPLTGSWREWIKILRNTIDRTQKYSLDGTVFYQEEDEETNVTEGIGVLAFYSNHHGDYNQKEIMVLMRKAFVQSVKYEKNQGSRVHAT